MDVSLPYSRLDFQKALAHYDIKVRRELCFQLIRNFDRNIEASNIAAVVSRLKHSAKYSLDQPRLIVGRESRAFANQAYLFANSKLIRANAGLREHTSSLQSLCTAKKLNEFICQEMPGTGVNSQLDDLLTQLANTFAQFIFELVPSIGRLVSLVFNQSNASSFTQFNGAFQNMREALEIFLRKAASEVEQQRKKFIESFYESSTRFISGGGEKNRPVEFFAQILNELTKYAGK